MMLGMLAALLVIYVFLSILLLCWSRFSLGVLLICALVGAAIGYGIFSYHSEVFLALLFPPAVGADAFDSIGYVMRSEEELYWSVSWLLRTFGWLIGVGLFGLAFLFSRLYEARRVRRRHQSCQINSG
ncbi:hypothetical protein [Pseudomonas abyssi]|nr:hypothetical protein [Halopseudomonas gallaeciensis]